MRIEYNIHAKAFAFCQAFQGKEYQTNLGQLHDHTLRIINMYTPAPSFEDAYDNLLEAVKKLAELEYDPLVDPENYE